MEKKQNNKWIENCLGFRNISYTTPSGNGEAIPQYKLDKTGKMVPKLNEHGKPLTKNLYLQIQAQKETTNYKKLINDLGMDLEKINLVLKTQNPNEYDYYKDFTNFGDIETLKSMENKILNTFGSYENFNKFTNEQIKKYGTQLQNQKKVWEKYKKTLEQRKQQQNSDNSQK